MTAWTYTSLPIIQAPMAGGATTPELVAAVCNAGGLGSLAAGYMSPEAIKQAIIAIRQLTHKPFAVNLFINEEVHSTPLALQQAWNAINESSAELIINELINMPLPPYLPNFNEQLNILIEEKVPIFSFTFGIPSESIIRKLKENNIILIGTATSLDEAIALQDAGIDICVAQGSEAGGHRGTFIGNAEDALTPIHVLIPLLVKNLHIPIVAAGGIMNADDIRVALKLGAQAVQMGTAFLTCNESGIHPLYKNKLLQIKQDGTLLTKVFSGKLARGINNKFIERMKSHDDAILPYPIQHALTTPMRKLAAVKNNIEYMSLWAGERAYLCRELSASQLIEELMR